MLTKLLAWFRKPEPQPVQVSFTAERLAAELRQLYTRVAVNEDSVVVFNEGTVAAWIILDGPGTADVYFCNHCSPNFAAALALDLNDLLRTYIGRVTFVATRLDMEAASVN